MLMSFLYGIIIMSVMFPIVVRFLRYTPTCFAAAGTALETLFHLALTTGRRKGGLNRSVNNGRVEKITDR